MWFAGDDTGILCRKRQDQQAMSRASSRIAWRRQETTVHGLGLVLKNPKTNVRRINMLSRYLAWTPEGPIVVKMIPKLLLLNASCSPKVHPHDAHLLAAMAYYAYGLDPLSAKLMKLRLNMIPMRHKIDENKVLDHFVQERIYKIGIMKSYTSAQTAFALSMKLS